MNRSHILFSVVITAILFYGIQCAEEDAPLESTEQPQPTTTEEDTESLDENELDVDPILVDRLTKVYLRKENRLWTVIEKRKDDTLQQIYNVHTDFLSRYYGESNAFSNGVYTNTKVLNTIISINETSLDIAREFFEHRNYSVLSIKSLKGINLLPIEFNLIYNETINSTDFWMSLKNVSGKWHVESLRQRLLFGILFLLN